MVEATNAQFDHVDYTDIPKGQAWLHQSWSGNVGSAFLFLPKGDEALNVSYYWPGSDRRDPRQRRQRHDRLLKSGKDPVLAHLLVELRLGRQERLHELHDLDRLSDAAEELHDPTLVGDSGSSPSTASTVVTEERLREGIPRAGTAARRGRPVAGRIRRDSRRVSSEAPALARTGLGSGGRGVRARRRRCSCSSFSCSRSTSCWPSHSAHDPILQQPVPVLEPARLEPGVLSFTLSNLTHTDGLYHAPSSIHSSSWGSRRCSAC